MTTANIRVHDRVRRFNRIRVWRRASAPYPIQAPITSVIPAARSSTRARLRISSAANYLYDKAQKAADKIRNSTKSVEKTQDKRPANNAVYQLVDNTGQPQYIGRTTNLEARKESHAQNPYRKDLKLEVITSNLTYEESRGPGGR